ncbi:hypothetical protein HETIRDRAFT_306312 [Heterobasidion irregulare TC 32-1]|uniref:Uncharacterized protein n=1 Tax=Heterobasidion irregulare (strain TC 32-1) TaxID=747525 RepID=W4KL78_HETIT|nr:uncharacterized protein HETIRDRAFT_306312 [Heterobasidion irregulare TC 32-1]ETW86459.1 hypothetical protein HETIRDRAFT_306312 [Heterobasidion irregulare TC 32-1]
MLPHQPRHVHIPASPSNSLDVTIGTPTAIAKPAPNLICSTEATNKVTEHQPASARANTVPGTLPNSPPKKHSKVLAKEKYKASIISTQNVFLAHWLQHYPNSYYYECSNAYAALCADKMKVCTQFLDQRVICGFICMVS